MGNKMNCVVVPKRATGAPILAAAENALRGAKVPFKLHDDPLQSAFWFVINADDFQQKARAVFDQLKSDGRIDDYEVKEK